MILSSLSICASFVFTNIELNKTIDGEEISAATSEFTNTTLSSSMTISLKDNTDEEIKSYYSSLSSKSSSELRGTNLLKNLKGIISKNVSYYSYDNVSNIYAITDRDWDNSPASQIGGGGAYDEITQTITNYSHTNEISSRQSTDLYLHALYVDRSTKDKFLYKSDGDVDSTTVSFDKEHVWSQSHGFSDGKTENLTGAGSDLHHLMAGAQYGNRTLHSNYSYGFVGKEDNIDSTKTYETKNKRGTPLFPHEREDKENKVFEPQDCDKGDIARALLYMVACYNEYDDSTATMANPHLNLVNYVVNTTGFSSLDITNGYYGVIEDLLAWHKLDPVDEYEIHRNNLIYNNYQHNRNPFIDYPEWADYIWGVAKYDSEEKILTYNSTPTGYVNLSNDVINGYMLDTSSLKVTTLPNKTTYNLKDELDTTGIVVNRILEDGSSIDVTKECTFSPTTLTKAGIQEITITHKLSGLTTTFTVEVNNIDISQDGTYYRKMSTSDTISDGNYIVTANKDGTYYALSNSFPISAGKINGTKIEVNDDKIDVTNSSGYVVNITKSSNYYLLSDGNNYLAYKSETNLIKSASSTDSTSLWSISTLETSTKGSYKITNSSEPTRYLGYSSSDDYFGVFKSNTSNYFYIELFKEEQASNFAYEFMNAFVCNNGTSEPTFHDDYSWDSLTTTYNNLDSADRLLLTNATANENGTTVEQAVARYDTVIKHWGISKYPDFMNRNVSSLVDTLKIRYNENLTIIIIISALIVTISIGGFYILKRKTHTINQ